MNSETNQVNRASGAAVGFIIAGLLFLALAVAVKCLVKAPAIDAAGAAVRAKDLAEIRAVEEKSLATAGWIDPSRGLVRLPIDTAMQITARDWRDPEAARSNLIQRAEQAAAPAPAAPAAPNPFQ